MRLLVFTDLHGSQAALASVLEKARVADVLLFAGDLDHRAPDIEGLMARLSQTKKPCLVIHGNWDEPSAMHRACDRHDNLHFLHRGIYEQDGVKFLGHGGGGFMRTDKDFQTLWDKFLRKQLKPGDKSVLITHAPPYGTKVDSLYGESRGNETYRKFIDEHQPLVHVCGHFHENFGRTDKVGKTFVINPGPSGVYVEIE